MDEERQFSRAAAREILRRVTYDEGVDRLRTWAGREVIAVWLTPDPHEGVSSMPTRGKLELRDMWPDADPSENPQRKGEVEFVEVRPLQAQAAVRPNVLTVALHRSVFLRAMSRRGEQGLAFQTNGGRRIDFWLDD